MPINPFTARGNIIGGEDDLKGTMWFIEFCYSAFYALFGWRRSFTAMKTFDFPNIAAGGEATTTLAVAGARQGDAVIVTSKTKIAGLGVDGFVLANDVVTIRRFNYSLGAIDPASDDFRCVVLQQ